MCIPVEHYYDRKPHAYFCSRHYHDEKYHNLPLRIAQVGGECSQQQIDGVEHQFNTHQYHNGVPANQYPEHSNAKQRSAEPHVVVDRYLSNYF